jgi:hypothetical protein
MALQEAALTGQMGLLQLLMTRPAWHLLLLLLLVPSLLQVPQVFLLEAVLVLVVLAAGAQAQFPVLQPARQLQLGHHDQPAQPVAVLQHQIAAAAAGHCTHQQQ